MSDTITIESPLDMHLHLRDGDMLKLVAPHSAKSFAGGMVMPNLRPPVTTIEQALEYKDWIKIAAKDESYEPYMTLFLQDHFDYAFLEKAKEAGIIAMKLYPAGATTNSEEGINKIINDKTRKIFDAMAELDIPLPIHGETNGFVLDREKEFGTIFEELAKNFPKLKIMMEHISAKETVELLDRYENLYATVTYHHMTITLDELIGGMLNPHCFCKPVVKTPEDRDAILNLALSGHPRVMFGSDSAPHPVESKLTAKGAAGIFTAPIALQGVVDLFVKHGKEANLQAFLSDNAQKIYGITPPKKSITLKKEPFQIPEMYGNVVPLFAGERMEWSLQE